MARRIKLDPNSIISAKLRSLLPRYDAISTMMVERAKELAPTDTRDYINSFKINKAKIEGTKIKSWITNSSKHAEWVETWFRKAPVNRHKWPPRTASTRIYTWIWANVQQRVAVEFTPKIPKLLWSKQ